MGAASPTDSPRRRGHVTALARGEEATPGSGVPHETHLAYPRPRPNCPIPSHEARWRRRGGRKEATCVMRRDVDRTRLVRSTACPSFPHGQDHGDTSNPTLRKKRHGQAHGASPILSWWVLQLLREEKTETRRRTRACSDVAGGSEVQSVILPFLFFVLSSFPPTESLETTKTFKALPPQGKERRERCPAACLLCTCAYSFLRGCWCTPAAPPQSPFSSTNHRARKACGGRPPNHPHKRVQRTLSEPPQGPEKKCALGHASSPSCMYHRLEVGGGKTTSKIFATPMARAPETPKKKRKQPHQVVVGVARKKASRVVAFFPPFLRSCVMYKGYLGPLSPSRRLGSPFSPENQVEFLRSAPQQHLLLIARLFSKEGGREDLPRGMSLKGVTRGKKPTRKCGGAYSRCPSHSESQPHTHLNPGGGGGE